MEEIRNKDPFAGLQLFAEAGASDGGGEAGEAAPLPAAPGDTAPAREEAQPREPEPQGDRALRDLLRRKQAEAAAAREAPAPARPEAGAEPPDPGFVRHLRGLERQAEEMKTLFPGFDLRRELDNPAFARMTAPDVGIRVEDAYYAVHRQEIQSAAMQVTAQKTAQMLSDAVRSGSLRPREHGTVSQGASLTGFDYRSATPQQKAALKKRIREATARGEKLYPGR